MTNDHHLISFCVFVFSLFSFIFVCACVSVWFFIYEIINHKIKKKQKKNYFWQIPNCWFFIENNITLCHSLMFIYNKSPNTYRLKHHWNKQINYLFHFIFFFFFILLFDFDFGIDFCFCYWNFNRLTQHLRNFAPKIWCPNYWIFGWDCNTITSHTARPKY